MRTHNTCKLIMDCARNICLEEGFNTLSMRKVADRVGVSATAIYRHFENKESLVSRIIYEGFDTLSTYLAKSLGGKTPISRFTMMLNHYLQFSIDYPKYYEMIFISGAQFEVNMLPEAYREKVSEPFNFLVNRVRECTESGIFSTKDPVGTAFVVWAHVHGIASLNLAHKFTGGTAETVPKTSIQDVFQNGIDLLVKGLTTPNPTRRETAHEQGTNPTDQS